MIAKKSTHVRLPERSGTVAGPQQIPGQPLKIPSVAYSRTTGQDPIMKPKGLTP
jgi:hypothetical protein